MGALSFFIPRRALPLTWFFLCSITNLWALDPRHTPSQYRYDEWNMTDGLPYTAVRSIYQSRDGYLWLATRAGFSRFDGVGFSNFSLSGVNQAPGVEEITFFAEDNRDRL